MHHSFNIMFKKPWKTAVYLIETSRVTAGKRYFTSLPMRPQIDLLNCLIDFSKPNEEGAGEKIRQKRCDRSGEVCRELFSDHGIVQDQSSPSLSQNNFRKRTVRTIKSALELLSNDIIYKIIDDESNLEKRGMAFLDPSSHRKDIC